MLCFEHFQPVYDEFLPDTTKSSMIRRLVEYAERRLEITRLLESLRQANPAQYALHAERLFAVVEPTAAFSPLREPARSASAGVAALLTLLQAADVRVGDRRISETDFEASGTQIRALVRGKRLHDLFQQLHDRCRLLEIDRRRLAGDATAWEGLLLNLPEAESIIGGLMDVTTAPALPVKTHGGSNR